jgi:thymidine phosphorylase
VHAGYPSDLDFARQACAKSTGYTVGPAANVPHVFVEF